MGLALVSLCSSCHGEAVPSSSSEPTLPSDSRALSPIDYALTHLEGEDVLGRRVLPADNYRKDLKSVGLFYSLWAGQHADIQKAIYNVTYLLRSEEGRAALADTNDNALSGLNQFHYWGEPLYGYYNSSDPFVLSRHIELLTLAGIDYLCIDATNAIVYYQSTETLLKLLLKYQNQGWKVPKVCFYTNSMSGNTAELLYSNFYTQLEYAPLWFSLDGKKPLLIGITEKNNKASDQTKYASYSNYISATLQAYFDVRESEWPNGDYNANSIPWMSWQCPQTIHTETGSIAVPVAQHSHSKIYVSSEDPECSRGYNNKTHEVEKDYTAGRSFQDMWDNVFERKDEITNVLATSWNEWMAIKSVNSSTNPNGPFWVDVYSEEYSRDMEMEKGALQDNFYLQLLRNVRRLKMTDYVAYQKKNVAIDITGNAVSPLWEYVDAQYQDFEGDAMVRDYKGAVPSLAYHDGSARNDFRLIRVANDETKIYFYLECAQDITPYNGTDKNYMNILIHTSANDPSFAGFNYVVNRSLEKGISSVEKSEGGYVWKETGKANYRIKSNVMEVSIPKEALGIAGTPAFSFKVADHVTAYDDIMDYYVTGDVAPIGRLRYAY